MKHDLGGGEYIDDGGLDHPWIFQGMVREDGKVQGRMYTFVRRASSYVESTKAYYAGMEAEAREKQLFDEYCGKSRKLFNGNTHRSCVVSVENLARFAMRNKLPVLLYRGENHWEMWICEGKNMTVKSR